MDPTAHNQLDEKGCSAAQNMATLLHVIKTTLLSESMALHGNFQPPRMNLIPDSGSPCFGEAADVQGPKEFLDPELGSPMLRCWQLLESHLELGTLM